MLQHIRQTVALLARRPGSIMTPIIVLTLGISATTAIFSIVNAALLRSLPGVRQAEELVLIQRVQDGQLLGSFGYPDYLDYQKETRLLRGVAAVGRAFLNYDHGDRVERISGAVVSSNYFSVLGVQPAAGRLLVQDDESSQAANVVLGYSLWQRDFSGDAAVIGRPVQLNGYTFAVVGVAPKSFTGTSIGTSIDVFLPVTTQPLALPYMSSGILQNRAAGWLTLFGRLGPGVHLAQAQDELTAIAAALGQSYPDTNGRRTVRTFPGIGMDPDLKERLTRFLGLLLGAVFLLLLISCGNVSNLLLARGNARRGEIAVRLALGAGKRQILVPLLTEGFVIAAAACLLSLPFSLAITPWILTRQPASYGLQKLAVEFDWHVFTFAALAALLTVALCMLAPISEAMKVDLLTPLRQGTVGGGRQRVVFRNALVVFQVMLSVVLLIAAGLVLRTMRHVLDTDEGFETKRIALASLDLTTSGYTASRGAVYYQQLLRLAQSIPGVASASIAGTVPPNEISARQAVFYPGRQPANIQGREFDPNNLRVDTNSVGPNYFRTMGISLLRGRDFTLQDREGAESVAIINSRLAESLWPGQDAIGKRLAVPEFAGTSDPNVEIIGIAPSTRNRSLLQTAQPVLYLPTLQRYNGRATLIVRTATEDPSLVVPELLRQVAELDKSVPLFAVQTMSEHIGVSLWQQQVAVGLIGSFGMLAVVLASIGLFGIIENSVWERTREIGIRVALGSRLSGIRGMILKQSFALVLTGIAFGILATLVLTRFLSDLLYEVSPHDPATFTAACVALCIVALAASEIPIRRALRVDPSRALRQ